MRARLLIVKYLLKQRQNVSTQDMLGKAPRQIILMDTKMCLLWNKSLFARTELLGRFAMGLGQQMMSITSMVTGRIIVLLTFAYPQGAKTLETGKNFQETNQDMLAFHFANSERTGTQE